MYGPMMESFGVSITILRERDGGGKHHNVWGYDGECFGVSITMQGMGRYKYGAMIESFTAVGFQLNDHTILHATHSKLEG